MPGKTVKTADVAKAVSKYKLEPEIIYSGEGNKQIVIRTIKSLDSGERAKVISTINEKFGTTGKRRSVAQELLTNRPSGKELRNNAILAVVIAAICMLIYIVGSDSSQWKFGGAALLGVLHDVLIVMAFHAIFNVTVRHVRSSQVCI